MINKQNFECMMLHGWGVSNTVWHDFVGRLNYFDNVSTPCLYEVASKTKDNKFKSIARALSKSINSDCVVIAWSIGGLIATQLAGLTDKVKAIIFIASTPCFVNKEDWLNALDKKSINDLRIKLSINPMAALEYFAGLIAHGDVSSKKTINVIRHNFANEKYSAILSSWLMEMQQSDQRNEFASLRVPTQVLLGEHDALVCYRIENQIKQLDSYTRCTIIKDCGHAPFISRPEETNKLISGFVSAEFKQQ
ncbi:MAG: alpha/beta fold hydrolase [Proteobacteria bacterium]|nr:alpha/beta fold hydrolase [Pseudomonadota bacterium]